MKTTKRDPDIDYLHLYYLWPRNIFNKYIQRISTSIFAIFLPSVVSNILVQIVQRNIPILALVVRGESHEHGVIPGDGDVQLCHVIVSVLPHPKSKLAKWLCIVPE